MAKNTGIGYEVLTKSLFEALLRQDKVETVRIEHNIELEGKTGTHQIDVYWEFRAGEVTYYTVVQAKDWGQAVPQGTVWQFKGVLDDLHVRANGIIVTRTGFQTGAKTVARDNGILLYELRPMEERDWDGRVRTINLRFGILEAGVTSVTIAADQEWLKNQREAGVISERENIEINGLSGDLILTDETGNQIGTMADVFHQHLPQPMAVMPATTITHEFPQPTFISAKHPRLTRLKIKSFTATIEVKSHDRNFQLAADEFVHFILKNVLSGTEKLINQNKLVIK